MSHHQIYINRSAATYALVLPGTAIFGRLNSFLHGGKEIYTTGLEMTKVVFGGDVISLLQNKLLHLLKTKWVFS